MSGIMGKRIRMGLLLTALLAAGLPMFIVGSSSTAGAICKGKDTPDPVWRTYGKEEAQSWYTCDADGFYLGKIKDKKTDGYCADVRIKVPDFALIPETGWNTQGISCTLNVWSNYYYDQTATWLLENGEQDRDVVVCKANTYICKYTKAEFMWGY